MTALTITTRAQTLGVADTWSAVTFQPPPSFISERVARGRRHLVALSLDDDGLDWETLGRVDEEAWGLTPEPPQ